MTFWRREPVEETGPGFLIYGFQSATCDLPVRADAGDVVPSIPKSEIYSQATHRSRVGVPLNRAPSSGVIQLPISRADCSAEGVRLDPWRARALEGELDDDARHPFTDKDQHRCHLAAAGEVGRGTFAIGQEVAKHARLVPVSSVGPTGFEPTTKRL